MHNINSFLGGNLVVEMPAIESRFSILGLALTLRGQRPSFLGSSPIVVNSSKSV